MYFATFFRNKDVLFCNYNYSDNLVIFWSMFEIPPNFEFKNSTKYLEISSMRNNFFWLFLIESSSEIIKAYRVNFIKKELNFCKNYQKLLKWVESNNARANKPAQLVRNAFFINVKIHWVQSGWPDAFLKSHPQFHKSSLFAISKLFFKSYQIC